MWHLLAASLIWGFSFGLIGQVLSGLPAAWVATARLAVAALVFLPFARRVPVRAGLSLLAVGGVQFGLMYLAYTASFSHLRAYEVALFTVTTPLFVAALSDLLARRLTTANHLAALLAVCGAGLTLWRGLPGRGTLLGFLLVQAANLCFAVGQLGYRACFSGPGRASLRDRDVIFWPYLGGLAALLPFVLWAGPLPPPTPTLKQLAALLYLGAIASGLGFFLWNAGARRVRPGVLAVANNLKIPFGVLCSLTLFGERAHPTALAAGGLLVAAALVPALRKKG